MPKIRKKLGIGSRDSASFGPIIHFEQLEQRIMLSGNGLLSSALNQDKDAILDNNLEIVQEAELLHKEVQDEEQISLEPITSDTTNNEVYQPICTLLPGDENNDKLADDELSVDDYNPTLIGDVLAVLSNNPECDIDGKIIETQESVIPIYDSDADLSKEYATSIEIRGPPAQDQGAYRNQILFIDSALKHYLQLDNAASSDVEVIALPAEQDGIQYISNIISYYDNVSALHIMTHGALGRLKFGMAELTQASFDQYTDALEIWSDALAVDGDLLLYGCSVAQSDAGQAFINRIAELTGADVAASIDLTGSAALGGDWVLERMTGPIEASVLGMSLVADFQGLLQDDHGDNAASSTAVLVPSSTAGDIEVLGDVDWFRFSAIAGTEYTFETVLGTLSDSVLTLIHTNGVTQIVFDDDSGGGLASRIEWTAPVNGTYYLEVGSFDDTYTGTYSLEITSDSVQPGLTLSIAQASISESGGVSQATVTRSPGTSGSLTVTLTSSDTTEATVPSTVTIPDGIGSALFTVTGVDDSIVDGTQTVTIIASALGYTNGVDTIDVSDDDLTPTVDLIVTKTESTDPVVAGSGTGNLAYVVTVTNNGPSDATGVMLNENLTLPSGVTIDSIVPSVGSYAGNTWTVGDLAVGTSETLTITLTVDSSALSCTDTISNTASVTAVNETDSNPANDSATESTSVIREVDLVVINMESIDPVIAGSGTGNLVYVVTVTNNGPSDATGITIFEDLTLPAGVSVDSVVPYSGVYTMTTAPDGIWTLDLVSGFSATLIVALTVGDYTAAGTDVIINTAAVTGTSGGEIIINTGDDTATESTSVSREVDLVVTKIESIDPVVAGSGAGNLVYVITVANNGPSDATNVTISEDLTLPASVSVDSVVPSSGVYTTTTTPDGTWTLDLAAGTSETLTIVMTVDSNTADGAIVSDTVTVTAVNETLINTGDDTASESTSVLHEVVPPVVTVTNPNGGENWPIGSVHDITWNATDNVAVTSIDILYSSSGAGGSFISIANGEANDGMYPWAIPNDPTTNAFVKVIAYDAAGNSAEDLSDGPFTISDQTAPSVTVTAPNGGQDWPLGSVHDITWNGTDNIGVTSIDILYSNNGSSGSFISIASGEANDGTYTWTIPNDPTTNAFVKVIAYDAAGNSGEDLSDGPFTIRMLDTTAPTMVNLSPADDAVGVDPDTDLVIHFSEDVQKGTGNIVIKRASDDLVFEIVDVTAAGVTVSGVVATIDLSTTLVKGTDYYVQVDVGAFMDLATNAFAGISDATTWNFKIVENMAPVITSISNSSPGVGDTAAGQQITVDAQFTDVNTLDNHTAVIDWGDGTITPGQVIESNGSGSVFGSHIYIDGGIYNITLTLTDNYGGLATGNTIAVITGVRVHNGVLQIIGTSKKDHITVNQRRSSHRHGTQFMVHTDFWGGYTTFDADNIDNIVILTGDGNDKVTIARNINVLVLVDGGVGNDNLKGGRGADIVLGAEGNDNLQGGPGRDILIGGDGSDRIIGNSGDDLLIGGPTLFDIDDSNLGQIFVTPGQEFDEALMAILAEWNSERDFDTRVDNLTNGSGSNDRLNGQYFLRQGSTVYDDGLKDHMTGSSGKDWLISFDSNKYHWWRRWDNRGRNLIRHR